MPSSGTDEGYIQRCEGKRVRADIAIILRQRTVPQTCLWVAADAGDYLSVVLICMQDQGADKHLQ